MARSIAPGLSVFMLARCSRIPERMASVSDGACLHPQQNAAAASNATIRKRERTDAVAMCSCFVSIAADCRKFLILVGLGGFEPPTSSLGNCCSIHLSYSPVPQHCNTFCARRGATGFGDCAADSKYCSARAVEQGLGEGWALLCRCADSLQWWANTL